MVERTSYAPGTPSWVDLGSPDPVAAATFYSGLFGWTASVAPQPEAGGYTMMEKNGLPVAGIGSKMSPDQPTVWTTYVTVEDADASAKLAADAGGTILMPPMDILDVGRMAILMDTGGAVFAIWQPRAHVGARLVNEPNTLCWNELATRDIEAAKSFYGTLFGWTGDTVPMDDMAYTEWKLADGSSMGGMMAMDDNYPPEVPPHWLVYFAVDDADATTARCTALGGTVTVPPTDIPPGRFAVLSDPQGALFAVLKLAEEGG